MLKRFSPRIPGYLIILNTISLTLRCSNASLQRSQGLSSHPQHPYKPNPKMLKRFSTKTPENIIILNTLLRQFDNLTITTLTQP